MTSGTEARGIPAALLIGSIALLVVLVSLPRFRAHVLDGNRADARVALRILGTAVFEPNPLGRLDRTSEDAHLRGLSPREDRREARTNAQPRSDEALSLYDVVRLSDWLHHRFPDARPLAGPTGLLHHGYRIDTGYVLDGPLRRPALVAWPDVFGRSGDAAFARTAEGSVFRHPNGGLWSGAGRDLTLVDLSDESWQALSR